MLINVKLFLMEIRKLDTDESFEEEDEYERIPTLSKSSFCNNLLRIFDGCHFNDRYLFSKSEDNNISVFKHKNPLATMADGTKVCPLQTYKPNKIFNQCKGETVDNAYKQQVTHIRCQFYRMPMVGRMTSDLIKVYPNLKKVKFSFKDTYELIKDVFKCIPRRRDL